MRLEIVKNKCSFRPQEFSVVLPLGSVIASAKAPTLNALKVILEDFFIVQEITEEAVLLEARH
jgi:hypothetical protein